jgi:hypothetical protein
LCQEIRTKKYNFRQRRRTRNVTHFWRGYSNLAAVAFAGKENGFKTIGIVQG